MTFSLRYAARSHVGLIRDGNEDSGYAGPHLLAVADGMGGQAAGEVASSTVVATLQPLDDDAPGAELLDALGIAVTDANERLHEMVDADPRLEGMGCTLTALLWTGSRLGLVHVGDSRAYLLRDGVLQQITQDHTWVQRLVDEGRITEDEASHHPQRSILMRAIDGRSDVEPDRSVWEVRAGDRYLLCSDGLSGVVSRETIESTLLTVPDPSKAVDALIELALRGGGPDNITCIVADIVNSAEAPVAYPVVVGAAAENRPPRLPAPNTSAGRASQLTAPSDDELTDTAELRLDALGEPQRKRGPRPLLVVLAGAVALAILGTAGYLWSQTQYYVGAHNERVAIYQGLNQKLFGLDLSHLEEETDLQLCRLSQDFQAQVRDTLPANNMREARSKVETLRQQAQANQPPTGTPSPSPGAPVSPTQSAPPAAQPGPGPSPATPSPAGPGTVPQADCGPVPGPAPSPGSSPGPR